MNLDIGFRTDVGHVRETNEDSYAVLTGAQVDESLDAIILVADGMGGGRGGGDASRIVAQTVPDTALEILAGQTNRPKKVEPTSLLRDAIARANTLVWAGQVEDSKLRGMGSTCVAAIVDGDRLTIGNVGDSRAYLLRDSKLRQLTEDHSEVWEQVRQGNMTREQARRSRYRNAITRAMGLTTDVDADVESMSLSSGDTLLLCSDGLTTELKDSAIARILACAPDAQSACNQLVEAALDLGGGDNITVVVARYGEFVPLAHGDTENVPTTDENDEEVTDPESPWRGRDRGTRPDFNDDDEFENMGGYVITGRPARRARFSLRTSLKNVSHPNFLIGVILLLVAIAATEGFALYVMLAPQAGKNGQGSPDGGPAAAPPKPTDGPLYYGKPTVVLSQPELRADHLLLNQDGYLIAIAKDGTILCISPSGSTTPIPSAPIPAPVARRGHGAGSDASQNSRFYMALDVSGYRYQTDAAHHIIQRFSPVGTRVAEAIGKGFLVNPGDIAVDQAGNIFVIDNNVLKRIPVIPPPMGESAPSSSIPSTTN